MRLSRNKVGAGALALGLIAAGLPALGQDKPESILPPGFNEPVPTPAATPTPTRVTPAAGGDRPGPSAGDPLPPTLLAPADAGLTVSDTAGTPQQVDPSLLAAYDIPGYARRSPAMAGVVGVAEGGLGPRAFGTANGRFLETLMRKMNAPIPSRWVSIGLRQALASKVAAPPGVNGADFAAERAWLLVRMGESVVARAMVESIDPDRYTPKMYQVAMQAALATGDPAAVCPVVDKALAVSSERAWVLAKAMCAALSGAPKQAGTLLKAAQRSGAARGIDLLLAEKIVGSGSKGQGAVTIEWDGVDRLTIWRYGLAMATGDTIPAALFSTVASQVQYWRAQAPRLTEVARAPAAELAAAQGVLSNAAIVDLYGKVESGDEQGAAELGIARDLRVAYADPDRDVRLTAMRTLWDEPKQPRAQYARLVLTARAATSIVPYKDAPDADRLIASMLSAGLEAPALRWQGNILRGSNGWGMLALVETGGMVTRGDVDTYRSRATDVSGSRVKMLVAGLAGLGRLSGNDTASLTKGLSIDLTSTNSWTRALHRAAERRQPATVMLLAAVGMQTPNWHGVSPEALYHIVSALQRVGLEGQARMIAVEALARL
ncbi:hypothetical protein [Sphingomonas sp. 28-63-12]|uniref:hypothetical protein n=1 Tax=Sphingomonas sp. 28-63-12 TaxID=1970434 RepID=UPI000BD6092A|nr:MAG: hypothetical protein B7Y47_04190 [Sphingomonas sp. 28-63-12]